MNYWWTKWIAYTHTPQKDPQEEDGWNYVLPLEMKKCDYLLKWKCYAEEVLCLCSLV